MIVYGTSIGLLCCWLFEHGERGPGLRNGFATRTATRSPTRPMRPSVNVISPQRTVTIASGLKFEHQRIADIQADHPGEGSRASYSTASTPICAVRFRSRDGLPRSSHGRIFRP